MIQLKIVFLSAGAGSTYCGACNQDVSLVSGLISKGHHVNFVPLYTPVLADGPTPLYKGVFYGGINTFLQQRFSFFRNRSFFLERFFDYPPILRWVSSFAIQTLPEKLGAMTLSVLRGEEGFQKKELRRLISFLGKLAYPDIIIITNSMLVGIIGPLKKKFHVPVVCLLQGEDEFILSLGEPYSNQVIQVLKKRAELIALFIAPSSGYRETMATFLGVSENCIQVVHPGIENIFFTGHRRENSSKIRIGYLSKIMPNKGLDLLCKAFIHLVRAHSKLELVVAGKIMDKGFWSMCLKDLKSAGIRGQMTFIDSPNVEEKVGILGELDIFSVPARYDKSKGIACLEAMAKGVPVVLPKQGIYAEIMGKIGGGIAVAPNDHQALASGLSKLINDPMLLNRLGGEARNGIQVHFNAVQRIDKIENILKQVIGKCL